MCAGRRKRGALAALVCVAALASPAAEAPAIGDFVGGPVNYMVRISPTGDFLAASMSIDNHSWFRIVSYPANETVASMDVGEGSRIYDFWWVADDLVLAAPIRRGIGTDIFVTASELFTLDAGNGRVRPMPRGAVLDVHVDDPDHVLILGGADRFREVHRLNVRNGRMKRLVRGAAPRGGFVTGPGGEIAFSTGVNADSEEEVHIRRGQKWELVTKHGLDDVGWNPVRHGTKPNTWLTYDSRGGPTTIGLGLYDDATGEHKAIIRHPQVDVSAIYSDFGGKRPWGVRFDHHYPAVQYLDTSHPLAVQHALLAKMYPEDMVTFTSTTRDHSKAIALVRGDRKPGDFILVDLEQRKLAHLMSRRPALRAEALAPMSPVELKVRDGTTVYGYLTSPAAAPRPGPLVVLVHGGPHGVRDTWGYRQEPQLLASGGYHVLQVNYRGSGGYGVDYQRAGFGEWGGRMQDDVTDATRWAIEAGIADPDRVCIYGASYGGYSALMGTAREPELYACAIGIAGVYDLALMTKAGDIRERRSGMHYLRRVLGSNRELLESRSPVHLAHRIEAEIMLVHGGFDRRVPPAHATRMRDALQNAGRDVDWLFDSDEGHGFVGTQSVVGLWERVLAFLERNIGDAAAAPG